MAAISGSRTTMATWCREFWHDEPFAIAAFGKLQKPNSKHQRNPNEPNSKRVAASGTVLGIGFWCFFGVSSLEFGVSRRFGSRSVRRRGCNGARRRADQGPDRILREHGPADLRRQLLQMSQSRQGQDQRRTRT